MCRALLCFACLGLFSCTQHHVVDGDGPACSGSGCRASPSEVDADRGDPVWPEPGGEAGEVIADPEDDASELFDPGRVRTYELTLNPADLARLDQAPAAEV